MRDNKVNLDDASTRIYDIYDNSDIESLRLHESGCIDGIDDYICFYYNIISASDIVESLNVISFCPDDIDIKSINSNYQRPYRFIRSMESVRIY